MRIALMENLQSTNCSNDEVGCDFNCSQLSCLLTEYECLSALGCNIYCSEEDSCIEMQVYAETESSEVTVQCQYSGSCRKMEVYVDGAESVTVY